MMPINIELDFSKSFGTARDQGQRSTCAAFAASDAHAHSRGPYEALSCEYAFYHAFKREGLSDPDDGVSLQVMKETIEFDGQPLEAGWPYIKSLPNDLSQWKPPANVGALYRAAGMHVSNDVAEIVSQLDQGSPVVLGMKISDAFFKITNEPLISANSNDPDAGNHAVLAIGHGTNGADKVILIRNSWGPGWRHNGMAWLTEDYLSPRLLESIVIG